MNILNTEKKKQTDKIKTVSTIIKHNQYQTFVEV